MIRALIFGMWAVGAALAVVGAVLALLMRDAITFAILDIGAIFCAALAALAWRRIP